MNTDLLAAYYELADVYEAVDLSRLCSNPYFFGQTSRPYDIVCYTLTSITVTSFISTASSVDVNTSDIIPTTVCAPVLP